MHARNRYLDLYLVHWPQAFAHVDGSNRGFPRNADGSMVYDLESTHEQTWKALEVHNEFDSCCLINRKKKRP